MWATGRAVFLNFDLSHSLEDYIKLVYYSNYPRPLYFQVQFLKLKCTGNTKDTTISALKNERKKIIKSLKKYQRQEKKIQGAKERYIFEIQSQEGSNQKILNKKNNIKKEKAGKF